MALRGANVHQCSFVSAPTVLCLLQCIAGVAVEVPADLPPKPIMLRWFAQPLKALLLPTSKCISQMQSSCVTRVAQQR